MGFMVRSMAVSVLNYLRIDRVDQAEKTVKAMSAIDDDSTVTQLATAWVNVFLVGHSSPPSPAGGFFIREHKTLCKTDALLGTSLALCLTSAQCGENRVRPL